MDAPVDDGSGDGNTDATTDGGTVDTGVDSTVDDGGSNADSGADSAIEAASTDDGSTDDASPGDDGSTDDGTTSEASTIVPSDDGSTDATLTDTGTGPGDDASSDDATCDTGWPDAGPNLVTNPDFETGTDGWTADSGGTLEVSTMAHCGTQSGAITGRTHTYQDFFMTLPGPGNYTVDLWVYQDSPDPGGVTLAVAQVVCEVVGDDGGVTKTFGGDGQGDFPTVPPQQWVNISYSLSVPTSLPSDSGTPCSTYKIQIGQASGTVAPDLYIDDVYISQQ